MRVAVISDIHGNLTALLAVVADLQQTSPDLVLHGGDLADAGSSPTEVIDLIRDRGWAGVMGNTDQMLVLPAALERFAATSSAPRAIWNAVRAIADATGERLGAERLEWLSHLPLISQQEGFALVHASPETCWETPSAGTGEDELHRVYGSLGKPRVVFGHTHCPSLRVLSGSPQLLVNTGSVGLPYDGDPRASYLILDDGAPTIRRVPYELDQELAALSRCRLPGADWTARTLRASFPQMP